MNSMKPLIIVAILAAIGVGLYIKINSLPEPQPPKDFSGSWGSPPAIDMGQLGSSGMPQMGDGSAASGSAAPSYAAPGGSAPAYAPSSDGGTAPVYLPPEVGSNPSAGPLAAALPGGHAHSNDPTVNKNANNGGGSVQDPFTAAGLPTDPAQSNIAPAHGLPAHDAAGSPANAGPAVSMGPTDPAATPNYAHDPNAHNPAGAVAGVATPQTLPNLLAPPQHATFDEAWRDARSLLERGDLAGAHLMLSSWYGHPTLRPQEQNALVDLLSGLAGTVIYSTEHHLEPAYVVQQGDSLERVAQQYNVPPELLAKINGIRDHREVQPGRQLKVVRGPFNSVVDLTKREMLLVLGGRYAGRFVIGVGRERANVEGRYEVKRKMPNPPYFGPDRTIEPGSPDNPLGTHFISLAKQLDNEIAAPFGIHGTNDAASLQREDPRGYIRLAPEHVADAYDILSEHSEVIIRR